MDSGSADTKQETRRQALQEKCSETGEPAWFFRLCRVAAQSFDNFTTHLEGQKHALNESRLVMGDLTALPKNATNMVKKRPKDQVRRRLPLILNPRMLLNMVKKRPKATFNISQV